MSFLAALQERARVSPRRIVFPEATDSRTVEAVAQLAREKLVRPILLGPERLHSELGVAAEGVTFVDPRTDVRLNAAAEHLWSRRKARGLSREEAYQLAAEPLLFGALMVALGEADGSVAGALNTTGEVLRAALWAVGMAAGLNTVSSAFYMVLRPLGGVGGESVLTFSDGAVVPDPSPIQLAEIALAAAEARGRIVGDEPRVAFLSYSTHGSAAGPLVDKVRQAVTIFRQRAPQIAADGELQADAALVELIGRRKAPSSPVAGRANVLIFPDLNAGNIGYKLVERLAGATALGPIVQGLARPCNDLSRGASVEDIVNVACITALIAG